MFENLFYFSLSPIILAVVSTALFRNIDWLKFFKMQYFSRLWGNIASTLFWVVLLVFLCLTYCFLYNLDFSVNATKWNLAELMASIWDSDYTRFLSIQLWEWNFNIESFLPKKTNLKEMYLTKELTHKPGIS